MVRIRNFNEIVAEELNEDNYEDWFEWVKNYLIAQDLWKVTRSGARPNRNRVKDFARWRRKNAAALHVIRISCGRNNHYLIRGASEAKVAWDSLYRTYYPPLSPPTLTNEQVDFDEAVFSKAICDNNWSATEAIIDRHPGALSAQLNSEGQTALHVAAKFGQVGIIEELVRLVPPENLEIQDINGCTPLAIAASYSGVIQIAECMISKNSNILGISDSLDKWIPVTLAFSYGMEEMGRYLYSVTPLEVLLEPAENGAPNGYMLVLVCLERRYLDIVWDLLQRHQELLFAQTDQGHSIIANIAYYSTAFRGRSHLVFWKRWIYQYITLLSTTSTNHLLVDIQQEGKSQKIQAELGLIKRLTSFTYDLLGIREIHEMKLQDAQEAGILSLIQENVILLERRKKDIVEKALNSAAMIGNVEFLSRVTKAKPELFGMNIFLNAVERRQAEVFQLIHRFPFTNVLAQRWYTSKNNLLHKAAMLAPLSHLNSISGAALQMQSEIQWFKAVENLDPINLLYKNEDDMTPLDLFKESHKQLRAEGEKWMKDTASSSSVVGALIVTIMFASAFTVPGGNDQTSGYPIFSREKLFIFFIISDALSLFSSTTSVLTFLGILTSRYAEEDFLYSLPKKLIIGLSALFLSIATMMMAFSATIIMMLQQRSHLTFLPVIMFASVPVTLFVLLQFPLLVQIISSTYGPGIFKKKVQKWP